MKYSSSSRPTSSRAARRNRTQAELIQPTCWTSVVVSVGRIALPETLPKAGGDQKLLAQGGEVIVTRLNGAIRVQHSPADCAGVWVRIQKATMASNEAPLTRVSLFNSST